MSFSALVTPIVMVAEKMIIATQKELETMEKPAQDTVPLTVPKKSSNALFLTTLLQDVKSHLYASPKKKTEAVNTATINNALYFASLRHKLFVWDPRTIRDVKLQINVSTAVGKVVLLNAVMKKSSVHNKQTVTITASKTKFASH